MLSKGPAIQGPQSKIIRPPTYFFSLPKKKKKEKKGAQN